LGRAASKSNEDAPEDDTQWVRNKTAISVSLNASLKVDFLGPRVTLDGSLILVRQLVERLRFSELIGQQLTDPRAKNTQLPLTEGTHLAARWRGDVWSARIAFGNESVGYTELAQDAKMESMVRTFAPRTQGEK